MNLLGMLVTVFRVGTVWSLALGELVNVALVDEETKNLAYTFDMKSFWCSRIGSY